MKSSLEKGFGFGLTSGIITTLGLIVGLHSSTHLPIAVIGGIIIIAIADAFSDAMGMHVSEEFELKHSKKEVWESSIMTFFSKFVFALTFVIPFVLFELSTAIFVSIAWGLSLITGFSFYLAKREKIKPYKVVIEHLAISILVIIVAHYVGDLVGSIFGG